MKVELRKYYEPHVIRGRNKVLARGKIGEEGRVE
jgi:hypothetical protein